MKNRNIWKSMSEFVLGKGFYIVLALCLVTVGVSGYYLMRSMARPIKNTQETGADTVVTIPSTEPAPVETVIPEIPDLPKTPVETLKPAQQAEPEQAQPKEEEAPKPAKAIVFTWPVKGEVLRAFSVDTLSLDPTLGDWRTHAGADISAAVGTRVLAMSAGVVSEVTQDDLMGTCVTVDHGDGLVSTYCNLAAEATVEAGEVVNTGDILGAVGESALAERELPAHLHLEASLNGTPVDPLEYLPER